MPKQVRSQATVERVLRAAAVVFAKHGIRGGSIHTIAKRSRVSIGSIYHHFGDRDGIAVALFQHQLDSLLAVVGEAYVAASTAQTALYALVDAYLAWVRHNPHGARILFFAGPAELQASEDPHLDANKQHRLMAIAARAHAFVTAGWLLPLPVEVLELVVIGPVAELARRSLCGAHEYATEPVVQSVKLAIWRSIAVDPTRDGGV